MKLQIFDSTLRDGAQGANISFSVDDKLKVIETLDRLGVDFIEAGNPFSNPAEMQFFQRIAGLKFEHAKIVAFGSTRRKVISAEALFERVWGEKYLSNSSNTVMVHIRHLREKLGESPERPRYIKTVWGVGYKIEA